jgi:serine/threonine-protein kinase
MAEQLDRLTTALAGRYRLERELGQGGMATVYLAEDLRHHRQVAVKVLRAELAAALGPERFLREITTTANLRHPHILPLYDSGVIPAGEGSGRPYYVMPFVDGESLRDRLVREKQLPIADALRIAREVAEALACAHAQGVLHRDIKPENILLERGHANLADFGIARAVDAAGAEQLTETGLAIGTPTYMSPEQSVGEGGLDRRSDLYSLGCVLYEMLAGEPPYSGPTAQAIVAKRLREPVPRVSTLRETVTPELEDVVSRLLAKSPADRFASAEDVVIRLAAVDTIAPGPARRWTLRRVAALAGAVGLLIAATLGVRRLTAPAPGRGAADVLAVLPFTVRASPALAYLGEGLVDLLSTSLDGAAGIRSVNAHALLSFVGHDGSAISLERARAVADHFQAGLFVVGDVLEVGGKLRLSASLFDRTRGGRPLAEATVDGQPADVLALVDLLGTRLTADRFAEGGARLTRSAAVTTSSLPALQAYLAGEQSYRAGQYAAAASAFQEAVAADTAFALAFYRLGMAQERLVWASDSRRSAELAFRHSSRLSAHDRRFLEAVLAMRRGRSGDAEQHLRAIVQTYPDDAEAWYQLGELLFHGSPLRGGSMASARDPFSRALFFDPGDLGALYHLARIAARDGDQHELDSLATRYYRLSPVGDRTLEMRALQAFTRHDTTGIDSVVAALGQASNAIVPIAVWSIAVFGQHVEGAERLARLLTEPARPRDVRAQGHVLLAHLALARGRLREVWRELGVADELGSPEAPLVDAWFRVLPFVPQSREQLDAARSRLARWDAGAVTLSTQASAFYSGHNGVHPILKTYLLGLLDARRGDSAGAAAHVTELDSVGHDSAVPLALELAQGLGIGIALAKGRPDSALAGLDALHIEGWYELTFLSPFYGGALERFTRAELLRTEGRGEEALAWYRGLGENTTQELVFLGPGTLAQARIQRALGRPREAAALYDAFLALWRESDPDLRPILDQARAERAQLVVS